MALFLTMILMLSFASCTIDVKQVVGNKNSEPATVTDNEGNIIKITAQELKDVYETNQPRFDKLYKGADITFVGTVKSISTTRESGGSTVYDKILFEEGWEVSLLAGDKESFLINVSAGDKIKVQSQINNAFVYVDVRGLATKSGGWTDRSLKQTKLSFAE